MAEQITYLRRSSIDKEKWDECITNAANSRIYAYSWYLDQMCDNWDALVSGDYSAVMPLPWRRKWFTRYLYHPALTAQLGVFGNHLSAQTVEAFLNHVPLEFRYWDLPLNSHNIFSLPGYQIYQRQNFVLDLHKSYEELSAAYRENIRRNIKKANQLGCKAQKNVTVEQVIEIARLQSHAVADADLERFKVLYHHLFAKGQAICYGIFSEQQQLLASAAFLFDGKRAYYLLVGNHANGRTLGASHALIDAFIRDHAGKELLLDFEGSDLRNLAFFYSSFGAVAEPYAAIRLNRLPWWSKWLKD